jgi:hypothetical protein
VARTYTEGAQADLERIQSITDANGVTDTAVFRELLFESCDLLAQYVAATRSYAAKCGIDLAGKRGVVAGQVVQRNSERRHRFVEACLSVPQSTGDYDSGVGDSIGQRAKPSFPG